MRLKNKVALITGASSGIGEATARVFAREGAKVGILGHTEEKVHSVVETITQNGGEALGLIADVSNEAEMAQAFNRLIERWGRVDIVFANAGINGVWAPVDELTLEEWNRTISTNLTGSFLTIKLAVPHMKQNGGVILLTSSVNGTRIFSMWGATAYSVSKAGQVAMMKMLALELARYNIRVNAICPGSVKTDISQNTERRNLDKVAIKVEFSKKIPLVDRPPDGGEVAELALFLASDAARHITGTPIWIDGAESLLKG